MIENKGITLIALVITIVVMIILAGISINILLGKNGIITKAIEAKEKQKIAELTEMLNLEKGSLAIEKQGVVTVEEYLKYIEEKGIIVGAENEVIQEGSVHITVDNGYIFLIEKINENDIKIEYQGKAGKLLPRIIKVEITNTTSSINLKVTSIRTDKYEYHIKKEDETDYTKKSEGTNAKYTFEGLEQNVVYNIKIVAKNKNGKVEEIKNVLTGEIELPELGDYSPKGWTKEDVTITLPTKEGYTTQYQIGGIAGTWINYKDPFTIGENKTIYYCYTDGTNKSNYASLNIQNIDKETPTSNVSAGNVANKKVMLTLEGTDNKSGISEYRIYEDGNLIKTITSNNTSETYEHTTTFGEKEIYVIVTDLVGNEKQSGTIKIEDLEIGTLEELKTFRDNVNGGNTYTGKTIKQISNIDMQGNESNKWTPIGKNSLVAFLGTFEGNNNTISNIYINNSEEDFQGLFGVIGNSTIQNVKLLSGTIIGKEQTGGIAGRTIGESKIINCYNKATINANRIAGGIVGAIGGNGIVNNCINDGNIQTELYAGGITGVGNIGNSQYPSKISNSTNNGIITSENYTGGIVGANGTGSIVESSQNTGKIIGKNGTGGIAGNIGENTKIANCINKGEVTSTIQETGGIAGQSYGTIQLCSNLGKVTGNVNIGGIVGVSLKNGIIEKSYNKATITGLNCIGGIAGNIAIGTNEQEASTIVSCYNLGDIVGGDKPFVGGIIGLNNGIVKDCYNGGKVQASENYVGGIAGINYLYSSRALLINCYNYGAITTIGPYIGGVAGDNRLNISNCYYLSGTAKGGILSSDVAGKAEVRTDSQLKALTSTLGSGFKADTSNINRGYPVLSWQ